jgi:hypothetical protein
MRLHALVQLDSTCTGTGFSLYSARTVRKNSLKMRTCTVCEYARENAAEVMHQAVAVQVDPFESKGLKPGNIFIGSTLETKRLSSKYLKSG